MFPSLVIPKLHLDVGNLLQVALPVQGLDQVISRGVFQAQLPWDLGILSF